MRQSAWLAVALLISCACFGAEPAYEPEGTALETGSAPSEISLANGVTLRASPRSSGTVFSDHLVLEEGAVRVGNFAGYTVDARQLHIQAGDPATQAVVRLSKDTIEVASLAGNLNVSTGGAVLTRITSGTRVSFQAQRAYPRSGRTASGEHVMLWIIVIAGIAALAIGLTAAAQGKSPF